MIHSALFQITNTFTRSDWRQFKDRLHSPLINKREDVLHLGLVLHQYRHQKPVDIPTKEQVFQTVYPTAEKYDDGQMRLIMHLLLKIVRQQLIDQELSQDAIIQETALADALRKRNLHHQAELRYERAFKALPKEPTGHNHLRRYQLKTAYLPPTNDRIKVKPFAQSEMEQDLTTFYAVELLRKACAEFSKAGNDPISPFAEEWVPQVITELKKRGELPKPVAVHIAAYQLRRHPDREVGLTVLLESIRKHETALTPSEREELMLWAINHCIKRQNLGEIQFRRRAFELYQEGLQRNWLLKDGKLTKFTYNNVLMLAIGLKEWDYADNFLTKYKSALPYGHQENIYAYNRAIFHFSQKEYSKAQRILRGLEIQDTFYNLNARRMLLQIYYETGADNALFSLLDSFQRYLNRQKNLGYHRELYANLIQFTRRLLQLTKRDKIGQQHLSADITNANAVAERAWLLAQLNS